MRKEIMQNIDTLLAIASEAELAIPSWVVALGTLAVLLLTILVIIKMLTKVFLPVYKMYCIFKEAIVRILSRNPGVPETTWGNVELV